MRMRFLKGARALRAQFRRNYCLSLCRPQLHNRWLLHLLLTDIFLIFLSILFRDGNLRIRLRWGHNSFLDRNLNVLCHSNFEFVSLIAARRKSTNRVRPYKRIFSAAMFHCWARPIPAVDPVSHSPNLTLVAAVLGCLSRLLSRFWLWGGQRFS